jgi:undecaprenyl pyrophosphate phosphatase UppP
VFALLAIGWMMRLLARRNFTIFVCYRLVLGGVLLAAVMAGLI